MPGFIYCQNNSLQKFNLKAGRDSKGIIVHESEPSEGQGVECPVKNILIIDHDAAALSRLSYDLKPFGEFRVFTARDMKEAVSLADTMNLVVVDADMPGIAPFQFLAYLKKKYPDMPVMATARQFTGEIRARLQPFGIIQGFEKPLDVGSFVEDVYETLHIAPAGRIQGISLPSLLQLIDLEKKTCTLSIKSGRETGKIYCQNGEVTDSETGGLKGKDALYQMMFWDKSIIDLKDECLKLSREIDLPIMHLLMESHQMKDEKEPAKEPLQPGLEVRERGNPLAEDKECFTDLPDSADVAASLIQNPGRKAGGNGGGADAAAKLAELFKKSPEIYEFAIFDENGAMRAGNIYSSIRPDLTPSVYLDMAGEISGVVGSNLKCIDIKTSRHIRYAMFKYRGQAILLGIKAGCRPMDFIQKVNI